MSQDLLIKKSSLPKIRKKQLIVVVVIIALINVFLPTIYFYSKYKEVKSMIDNPDKAAQEEIAFLTQKVSRLIDLPQDETPVIVTVTDTTKLQNQAFFAKAKNGDKVLVYNQAKKAFLYDPAADRIIEVGPLILPTPTEIIQLLPTEPEKKPSPLPSPTEAVEISAKAVLYNGTETPGLTGELESFFNEQAPGIEVIDRDNASREDYKTTLVIDLTGENEDITTQIAQLLQAETSNLPKGETEPENADILIILGADRE